MTTLRLIPKSLVAAIPIEAFAGLPRRKCGASQ
jgi:hypothetical protein